jgi:hypothetical protein
MVLSGRAQRRAGFSPKKKGNSMSDTNKLEELEKRISRLEDRDKIRDLGDRIKGLEGRTDALEKRQINLPWDQLYQRPENVIDPLAEALKTLPAQPGDQGGAANPNPKP